MKNIGTNKILEGHPDCLTIGTKCIKITHAIFIKRRRNRLEVTSQRLLTNHLPSFTISAFKVVMIPRRVKTYNIFKARPRRQL